MTRTSTAPGGRDRFACSLPVWTLLLQVAQSFGWKPRGTSYASDRPAFIESTVRHDYQPGDTRDQKRVEGRDALGWAIALNEARHSPHLPAMLTATSIGEHAAASTQAAVGDPADAPFDQVLGEFVAYAFGGAFFFALED